MSWLMERSWRLSYLDIRSWVTSNMPVVRWIQALMAGAVLCTCAFWITRSANFLTYPSALRHATLGPAASWQADLSSTIDAYDAMLQEIQSQAVAGGVPCARNSNCRPWLDRLIGPAGQSILVADAHGTITYQSPTLDAGTGSIVTKDYFFALRTDNTRAVYIGRSDPAKMLDGTASFIMSRPLRDATGGFAGIVAAAIPLSFPKPPMGTTNGLDLSAALLGSDGTLIGRSPAKGDENLSPGEKAVLAYVRYVPAAYFTADRPGQTPLAQAFYRVGGLPLVVEVSTQ